MKRFLALLLCLAIMGIRAPSAACFVFTSTPSFQAPSSPDRTIVIISDLHLGPGRNADGSWYRTEDFRWGKALKAFLDDISQKRTHHVDLIIAGDFLDMWQPPAHIRCEGAGPELGCTAAEMKTVASWTVGAHAQVFEDLRMFSQRGDNRLHIIPGNHDAALLIASVWEPLGKALAADGGRVNFAASGVWVSADGGIVVEHGHQIGSDANRYETWPHIVRSRDNREFIIRPWGEQFVQKIFNDQEMSYPVIDNLSPESAGLQYRMEDRGIGGSASDVAMFVAFSLFQTSLQQQVQFLGAGRSPEDRPDWDILKARNHGHRLFAAALPPESAIRASLIEKNDRAAAVRRELDALAFDPKRLPDGNVKMLCDQAAIRGNPVCATPELGYALERFLVPREWVIASHLAQRQKEFPKMRYFVYGHTHLLEESWKPGGVSGVDVLNSGAFHRVIDEDGFLKRAASKGISPGEALQRIAVEALPPCYTYVLVSCEKGVFKLEVWNWVMQESDNTGRVASPRDKVCR